jgi:response regulator of citrate/malate metabolism
MSAFLIADDSHGKIELLKHCVKSAQWPGEILIAMTTEEAMRLIDARPDIIGASIDYYIPSQNGPAIIQYLKKKIPNAHVALVSSAESEKNKAEGIAAGAEAFVCTTWQSDIVEQSLVDLFKQWRMDISPNPQDNTTL